MLSVIINDRSSKRVTWQPLYGVMLLVALTFNRRGAALQVNRIPGFTLKIVTKAIHFDVEMLCYRRMVHVKMIAMYLLVLLPMLLTIYLLKGVSLWDRPVMSAAGCC